MKKASINNTIVDVITMSEYGANPQIFPNNITGIYQSGYVLPVRGKLDDRPGVYPTSVGMFFRFPKTDEEREEYFVADGKLIDFDDVHSIQDVIQKQGILKSAEKTVLTTIDNIYVPEIGENDSPEMIGLKKAIIAKGIDIDKYEPRFGSNFNNDKRLLRKDSITMSKLKAMANALDIKCTLILEDKSPDVANPIGDQIIVNLTEGSEYDDGSERNDS